MTFRSRTLSLYDALGRSDHERGLPPIHPFIGSDFDAPNPARFRVLAIGVNSYVGDDDITCCVPEWFQGWVEHGRRQFFRTLRSECDHLAHGVVQLPQSRWTSSTFEPLNGLYGTNAVKRFLPHATGRWASHVEKRWLDEGSRTWREELRLLADHAVVPDLIVVFGERAWWPTCSVLLHLCEDSTETSFVRYAPMSSTSQVFHRLNVVHVMDRAAVRPCLVVRLDHPAARGRKWSAERMLMQPELIRAAT